MKSVWLQWAPARCLLTELVRPHWGFYAVNSPSYSVVSVEIPLDWCTVINAVLLQFHYISAAVLRSWNIPGAGGKEVSHISSGNVLVHSWRMEGRNMGDLYTNTASQRQRCRHSALTALNSFYLLSPWVKILFTRALKWWSIWWCLFMSLIPKRYIYTNAKYQSVSAAYSF